MYVTLGSDTEHELGYIQLCFIYISLNIIDAHENHYIVLSIIVIAHIIV